MKINNKMVIGIIVLLVLIILGLIGYINASKVNTDNLPEIKHEEIKKEEVQPVKEVVKEEKKEEVKETSIQDEIEKGLADGSKVNIGNESIDIILRNNEYVHDKYEIEYEYLDQFEDNVETDRRVIDKDFGISFKISKDSYQDIDIKNEGNFKTYGIEKNKKVYLALMAVTKKELTDEGFNGTIIESVEGFEEQGLFNKKYNDGWIGYRIGYSHTAWINTKDPNYDDAVIKDLNGNIYVVRIDKNMSEIKILDFVRNFEVFDAHSFRFIDQKDRDKIYLDRINSVTMQ